MPPPSPVGRGESPIARTIRETRKGYGLSQQEVGRRAGLTQAQISLFENNQVDLRLSSLMALVDVLGLQLVLKRRPGASVPIPPKKKKKKKKKTPKTKTKTQTKTKTKTHAKTQRKAS